jgi:hypothetical protein
MLKSPLFRPIKISLAIIFVLFASIDAHADRLMGDVDNNGTVNISDVISLVNYVLTSVDDTAIPFPCAINDSTIKVLSLGNSFAYYPTKYLSALADSAGIPSSSYRIRILYPQGRSLQQWASAIEENTTVSLMTDIGRASIHGEPGVTIRNLLSNDWDIIVLQQNSNNASDYNTHEPYLSQIIDAIHDYCPNPDVMIAWHMIWSKPGKNWYDIMAVSDSVLENENIDFVIPTGTAIENARHTHIWSNIDGNLMHDNSGHLAPGVGQYVGACAWFQTLLAPFFGVTVIGNSAVRTQEQVDSEWNALSNKLYPDSKIAVTEENSLLCQRCAVTACHNHQIITSNLDELVNINVANSDMNQDHVININDLILVINLILSM